MFQEAVSLGLNYHRFLAPGFHHIPQSHKNNTNSNNANHLNQAWKACFFLLFIIKIIFWLMIWLLYRCPIPDYCLNGGTCQFYSTLGEQTCQWVLIRNCTWSSNLKIIIMLMLMLMLMMLLMMTIGAMADLCLCSRCAKGYRGKRCERKYVVRKVKLLNSSQT